MAEQPQWITMYHGHPGQIVNNAKQVRQSKEEVEAEKAEKAEKKQAKVKETEKRWEVGIKHITAMEDEMQKQIMNVHQNATRPDKLNQDIHQEHLLIQQNKTRNLLTPADDASYDEMELETDDVSADTYDPADLPPMSTVGTSESEPELFGAGDEELGNDGDSDDEFIPKEVDKEVDEDNEKDIEAAFQSFMKCYNAEKSKAKADKAKKKEKVSFRHYNQSRLT